MPRSLHTAIGLCTALVCVFALDVPSHAQWAQWEIGSGPWGGMRYRGPLLRFDIGGAVPPPAVGRPPDDFGFGLPPTPPWHYRHDPPGAKGSLADQERFHYDLDRMHRYRTREERYADDFRDRYASGDPFYHADRNPAAATYQRAAAARIAPVPGLSYGPHGSGQRSFVADAEVGDLLRPAANRLTSSLSRMRDGAVWMKQLQPDRIITAIDQAEFPGALSDLVELYEGVLANPRLVLIAQADGFRDTHRLLSQYVSLQSRFGTQAYPDQEYEVFMSAGQRVLDEDSVLLDAEISLEPPSSLPWADEPQSIAGEANPAVEMQELPAPAPELDAPLP
jgi:hypothetical protein